MARGLQLTNKRFERLLVLEKLEQRHHNGAIQWRCKCDCGEEIIVIGSNLKSGNTKSCGCLDDENFFRISEKWTTHGMRQSGEYSVWSNIKERCERLTCASYPHYGGRGITYDPRWESFENFLEDMGERPSDKHTIERIDVNGNYCKENCIWTDDLSLQAYNGQIKSNNTSGRTGVYWCKSKNKWLAKIGKDNKLINLGQFNTKEEAIAAREEAELKYYGFNKS